MLNEPIAFPHNSRSIVVLATTGLAATFNMMATLILCFSVMPKMDSAVDEARSNRDTIIANKALLESILQEAKTFNIAVMDNTRKLEKANKTEKEP